MAWLPWAKLPARSNFTTQELVDWLRDRAIEFNAPPQFVDAIDHIGSLEAFEAENEELRQEIDDLKGEAVSLKGEIVSLESEIAELEKEVERLEQ